MVSIVSPASAVAANPTASLISLLQSSVVRLALLVNASQAKTILTRMVAAYAALALALGGFYERPWQLPVVALRVAYTTVITLAEYAARGFKPLFPEWTLPFELIRAIIRAMMSNYANRMLNASVAQYIRSQTAVVGTMFGYFVKRQLDIKTDSFIHNDLEHVWVRSARPKPATRRVVVLYIHGGGYAVLSPRLYIPFGCQLQSRIQHRLDDRFGPNDHVQVDLLLANYRKIPEHQHPVPVLDALTMYKYLLDHEKLSPSQIIIAGDSAGAGLTMGTMLRLRDSQPELAPVAAVLSCPFVDLEAIHDERKAPYCILGDQAAQCVLDAYHPRDGHPTTWGDASPVHCDLRNLPPVYIQAAELDYLLPHAKRLMQKAQEDGVTDWKMDVFPHVPHVFTTFPSAILPSAAKGLDAMADFAADHFAEAVSKTAKAF